MFGSLVIVYPTTHVGGALVFRHRGKEWTFDSATEVLQQSSPSIAYVAFFSDIEHEVTPVTSGYRVTLTYNLYFTSATEASVDTLLVNPIEASFKDAFSARLADPTFLPEGGTLGFGLRYQYPIPNSVYDHDLSEVLEYLKGGDATIVRVCNALGLSYSIRAIYKTQYDGPRRTRATRWTTGTAFIMLEKIPDLGGSEVEENTYDLLTGERSAKVIRIITHDDDEDHEEPDEKVEDVKWVTPVTPINRIETNFVTYGNEASLDAIYGDLALTVQVGKVGNRQTAEGLPPPSKRPRTDEEW